MPYSKDYKKAPFLHSKGMMLSIASLINTKTKLLDVQSDLKT